MFPHRQCWLSCHLLLPYLVTSSVSPPPGITYFPTSLAQSGSLASLCACVPAQSIWRRRLVRGLHAHLPIFSVPQGDESLQIFAGSDGDNLPLMEMGTCRVSLIRPPRLDPTDPSPTVYPVLGYGPTPPPIAMPCAGFLPHTFSYPVSTSTFPPICIQCSVSTPRLLPPA